MKKKSPSNPLKFFNDNKAKAKMKAGGAMKAFKKSLPKAQFGLPENTVNYYDPDKGYIELDTTGWANKTRGAYPYEMVANRIDPYTRDNHWKSYMTPSEVKDFLGNPGVKASMRVGKEKQKLIDQINASNKSAAEKKAAIKYIQSKK